MKSTIPSALLLQTLAETRVGKDCDLRVLLPPRITRHDPGNLVSAYQMMQYRPRERLHAKSFQLRPIPLVDLDRATSLQGQLWRQRDKCLVHKSSGHAFFLARTAIFRDTPSCRLPWLHLAPGYRGKATGA